ncbi:MAG: hypothetical protein OXQ29_15305 [Rhodospirillaceae bacterium]|nr:hypothetical protein [Rhodospirillaceae bacterium]
MNLDERIDAIEAGYEFMLAYAAQGRLTDSDASGSGVGFQLREFLGKMESALDGLGDEVAAVARQHGTDGRGIEDFLDAVAEDARKTLGLIRLVNSRPGISSMLIDNVNGSIHLRALLTDLFVVSEAFKGDPET